MLKRFKLKKYIYSKKKNYIYSNRASSILTLTTFKDNIFALTDILKGDIWKNKYRVYNIKPENIVNW
jgi:hypothetical protein